MGRSRAARGGAEVRRWAGPPQRNRAPRAGEGRARGQTAARRPIGSLPPRRDRISLPCVERYEVVALAVAAVAHVGLIGLHRIAPPPNLGPKGSPPAPIEALIEVEREDPVRKEEPARPPDAPPTPTSDEPRAAANTEPTQIGAARAAGPVLMGEGPAKVGDDTAPPAPTSTGPGPTTGPEQWGGPAPTAPGLPGLGPGGPIYLNPGVLAPMAAAPAPTAGEKRVVDPGIASKVISDALKDKDKKLGLDLPAAGTIASIVADVVRSSSTPNDSRGTIEVRLGPKGQVLGVRVVSSTGGAADVWAGVASSISSRLSGKGLMMTEQYAKGATVYVEVSSKMGLPSGTKDRIKREGAGATYDIADLGSHATRKVSTSFRVIAAK